MLEKLVFERYISASRSNVFTSQPKRLSEYEMDMLAVYIVSYVSGSYSQLLASYLPPMRKLPNLVNVCLEM